MAALRARIDAVDKQLLPLFLERMACVEEVGMAKLEAGMPVLDAGREQVILNRVRQQGGGFGEEAVQLYVAMMAISRARQSRMTAAGTQLRQLEESAPRSLPSQAGKVCCQGVEGAFSHRAAAALFPGGELSFQPSWQQVFEEIEAGRADFGVLPVENSAAGSVAGVYDLLIRYRYYLVAAVELSVRHELAVWDPEEPVRHVISHPQALAQCSAFLEERRLGTTEFSNTAAAAKYAAEHHPKGTGVICSREAAQRWGLTVVEENIQNEKDNRTRFVAVSRRAVLPDDADKISLCFALRDYPGSLQAVLQRIALVGNLTKLESRTIPGDAFHYDFFVDLSGNIHHRDTLELLCSLHDELPRFSFLGNYRSIRAQ